MPETTRDNPAYAGDMNEHAVMATPVIPGWNVGRIVTQAGVSWVATWADNLSAEHFAYGCTPVLSSTDARSLEILCAMESTRIGIVDAAVRLITRMAEPGRAWRVETP